MINLYPKGNGTGKDTHISLFAELVDPENSIPHGSDLFVETTIRILDRIHYEHEIKTGKDPLACFYFVTLYYGCRKKENLPYHHFFVAHRQFEVQRNNFKLGLGSIH